MLAFAFHMAWACAYFVNDYSRTQFSALTVIFVVNNFSPLSID